MRNTIDTYESLTQHAIQETFKHPKLLFVSILVAAVNTGSVLFHLYQFASILGPLNKLDISIVQALPPVAWIGISNLFTASGLGAVAVTVVLSILLFLAGVTAQQYLISAAHGRQGIIPRHKSHAFFTMQKPWMHLLYTNILYFLGLLALFVVGGALLTALPESYLFVYSFGSAVIYSLLILAAFCWNVIILLSLMHVVREGASVHDALRASFTHVVKHPLSVFELSCLQLVVEFVFAFVFIVIIGVASIVATMLVALLSATGSAFLLQTGLIFMGVTVALSILLFGGLITSFGYHLWARYHKESHTLRLKPIIIHLATQFKQALTRT